MRMSYRFAILVSVLALGAAGHAPAADAPSTQPNAVPAMPPSPSSVSGERIWPDPAFTHWPAVAYNDETRNVAFALPNKIPGQKGSIGWKGEEALPFTTPADTDRVSGLLPLPLAPGVRTAVLTLPSGAFELGIRLADAREPWPLAALKDGFPVDDKGIPVVLIDRRRKADEERKWGALRTSMPRPTGKAVVVGDPLEALGADTWSTLDAELRPALDERFPHHAVLVALAKLDKPRTIIWSPGNQALFGAAWTEEEERVLGVVRSRCEALSIQPRLVLVAPPIPMDEVLKEQSATRRDLLIRSANTQGWAVLDIERLVGSAESANKVREGLFTRYPNGPAQQKIVQALKDELAQ